MGNQINPLSLVIIGGFLGSGKTTLLKRLLSWEISQEHKPVVIMSEFGELDIDSILIDTSDITVRKIFGGCVCCNMKLSLLATIDDLYETNPGKTVYLETTGVADPAGVLEALTLAINKGKIDIKKIVLVYDASLNEALVEDRYMAEHQLMLADAILINRCDTVDAEECDKAEQYIREIKPSTPSFRTAFADVDPNSLMAKGTGERKYSEVYSSDRYVSVAFSSQKSLARECLSECLNEMSENVLRVKGIVKLANEDGVFEVQAVRKSYSILPLKTVRRHRSVLVIIGYDDSAKALLQKLESCVEQ